MAELKWVYMARLMPSLSKTGIVTLAPIECDARR